jgi:anti-sigma factor RsiW
MRGLTNRLRFRLDHRWTPPRVSSYLDGQLSRRRRARLEHHIADCPECRELLHGLDSLIVALARLRDDTGVPVAKAIFSSVRGRLDDPAPDRP